MCFRNFESIAMMSSKWPWMGQSLTIQIWPSRSMICAFISPTFSVTRMVGSIVGALRILLRASMTHLGQRLSVVRGKPSGGFDFCQDLSRGLSDHLGMNDSFGLYWLKNCIVLKMPPATVASAFSACLIGFICFPSRRSCLKFQSERPAVRENPPQESEPENIRESPLRGTPRVSYFKAPG